MHKIITYASKSVSDLIGRFQPSSNDEPSNSNNPQDKPSNVSSSWHNISIHSRVDDAVAGIEKPDTPTDSQATKKGKYTKSHTCTVKKHASETDLCKKTQPAVWKQSIQNIAYLAKASPLQEENEDSHESKDSLPGASVDGHNDVVIQDVTNDDGHAIHNTSTYSSDHLPRQAQKKYKKPRSSSGVTGSRVSLPRTISGNVRDSLTAYLDEQAASVLDTKRYVKRSSRLRSDSDIRQENMDNMPTKYRSEIQMKEGETITFLPQGRLSFPSIDGSSIASPYPDVHQQQKHDIATSTDSMLKRHQQNSKQNTSRRFERSKEVLSEHGKVFIKAYPGDGSTHLAMDLLLTACETHTPFILAKPSEFQICLQSESSAIFLVDDAFGRTACKASQMDKWMLYLDRTKTRIDDGTVKIIFIVKQNVAKGCSDILNKDPDCVVELIDPDVQLSVPEKVDIIEAMTLGIVSLQENIINGLASKAWSIGFPKRVNEFLRDRDDSGRTDEELFNAPSTDLMEMVELLGKIEPSKLVVSALIFLSDEDTINDGNIDSTFGALQAKVIAKSTFAHLHSKIAKRKPKEKWLRLLQKIVPLAKNLARSMRRDARKLTGTLLKISDKGCYELDAPCVQTVVLLELGKMFTSEVIDYSNDQFFKRFVYPECTDTNFGLAIPLHDGKSCNVAVHRLKSMILSENVEEAVQHPLLRDSLFVAIFFSTIGKEPSITRKIMLAKDKISGKTIISLGFENFYEFADGNPETLGGTILCHPKWQEIRKHQTKWTGEQEACAVYACCKNRLEDTFFNICTALRLHNKADKKCLSLAIDSGADRIVAHLIVALREHLTIDILGKALLKACINYCEGNCQTNNRERIILALLHLVPFDFESTGVESIVHFAGRTGNGRLLVLVEKFKGDINLPNVMKETCLHIAARYNQYQFIRVAVERGADPELRDVEGKYPIHVAADCDTGYDAFKVLCTRNPESLEFQDSYCRRPIHFASRRDKTDTLELLCNEGAAIEVRDHRGQTPLHYASMKSCQAVCVLLKFGADLNAIDENGDSPIDTACRARNLDILQQMLKFPHKKNPKCLFIAVKSRMKDIVEALLSNGYDENAMNLNGCTLLQYAIELDKDVVESVLKSKPDVNKPSRGIYPLHAALQKNDVELFKSLCDAGAIVSHVNETTGDTLLHEAVKQCASDDIIEAILDTGHPFINKVNTDLDTALHMATVRISVSTVEILLLRGSDVMNRNKKDQTAFELAEQGAQRIKKLHKRHQFQQIQTLLSSRQVEHF